MAAIPEKINGFTPTREFNRNASFGWLQASELPESPKWEKAIHDRVFVRMTRFPSGYGVEYVCPVEGTKMKSDTGIKILPHGLFFWESVKRVLTHPHSEIRYQGLDECYIPGCESACWYDEKALKEKNYRMYDQETKLHTSHVNLPIPSVTFPKECQSYWESTYSSTDPKQVDEVIQRLGKIPDIVNRWLRQKLISSGLKETDIQEVVRQFLYEETVMLLKTKLTVDVRDYLDIIASFSDCSSSLRKEMESELRERFGEDIERQGKEMTSMNLYKERNMTARGIIICCHGLCQQD